MNSPETIAAISSAVGSAARMIVRASGAHVREIHRGLTGSDGFAASTACRTDLRIAGLSVPGWVYSFASPHSATGEDLVELHIPGSPILARMLLDEIVRLGARHAEPGEFTARAYFNGKLDLTEAEGVAATIAAQSQRQLAAARQLMAGELARRLKPLMDSIAETLALVEVGIDFSEEDVTFISPSEARARVDAIDAALERLLSDSARFERLAHEPQLVLIGRPNAGKSTLLNALAGHERAVVSAHAGTTRDAIWAHVKLRRGTVRVIDVAGIESSDARDDVSRMMQEQARRSLEEADIVVQVHDCTDPRAPLATARMAHIQVRTKADLAVDPHQYPHSECKDGTAMLVSAQTGAGLGELREALDELAFGPESAGADGTLALNVRHVQSIEEARASLARARSILEAGPELLATDLRDALDHLGQILGAVTPDDVLGRVFSTFCIGK